MTRSKKTNHQWERVQATPMPELEFKKYILNKSIFENDKFGALCIKAGIMKSKRQASKFANQKGRVFKVANRIPFT